MSAPTPASDAAPAPAPASGSDSGSDATTAPSAKPLSPKELATYLRMARELLEGDHAMEGALRLMRYEAWLIYEHPNGAQLFLTNADGARTPSTLQKFGVTHVVCCAQSAFGIPEPSHYDKIHPLRGYHGFESDDIDGFPIVPKFAHDAAAFIDAALNSSSDARVFCHCQAGMNRSGAVVVAYLILKRRMGLFSALQLARERRGMVLWNESFRQQLILLAHEQGLLP